MRVSPTALAAFTIGIVAVTSTSSSYTADAFVVPHGVSSQRTRHHTPKNALLPPLRMSAPAREGQDINELTSDPIQAHNNNNNGKNAAPFFADATHSVKTTTTTSSSSATGTQQQHHAVASSSSPSLRSTGKATSIPQTSRTGRSISEINTELSSGKALGSGPVIDFGSVKATESKAEVALSKARAAYLASLESGGSSTLKVSGMDGTGRLMGINDEVVSEVGHEIGVYSNEVDVQGCAAYLRSRAPPGLFQTKESDEAQTTTFTDEDISRYQSLLEKSYDESGQVTSAFAKTFYLGTQLLPPHAQRAIWAIYVWCRRTDEIVDAPRQPSDPDMLTDLSAWEIRLENLWTYGTVVDVLDLCLLDVRIQYPNLGVEPFVDMVRGMLMDIPELGQDRYETFDALHLYCYRVAGTVGLMSMPIFGCAMGYTEEEAKEPALSLGVAFQITNILRDVGEDAAQRGRVYLPREDMAKFGVTEDQIFAKTMDSNYIDLMKYEIARARMYYDRALRGVPMLSPESRLPVQSSLDCYGMILDKIEENGYDTLNQRAYVSKWEKLATIPFSWYRTLDIAKVLPLPGDKPLGEEEETR